MRARVTPNGGNDPCVCGFIHPCCRFLVNGGCPHRMPGDHHHALDRVAEFLAADPARVSGDFDRADTANLGSGWSSTCRGFGTSIPAYTADSSYVDDDFSVSVVDPAKPLMVFAGGGWIEFGDVCPACTRRWEKDDVATSRNQQPFRHTDCNDPKLRKTT